MFVPPCHVREARESTSTAHHLNTQIVMSTWGHAQASGTSNEEGEEIASLLAYHIHAWYICFFFKYTHSKKIQT